MAGIEADLSRPRVIEVDETAFVRGAKVLADAISALDLLKRSPQDDLPVPIIKAADILIVGTDNQLYFNVPPGVTVYGVNECLNKMGQFKDRIRHEFDGVSLQRIDRAELSANPMSGEHRAVLKVLDVPDERYPHESKYHYIRRSWTVHDLGKLSIAAVNFGEVAAPQIEDYPPEYCG